MGHLKKSASGHLLKATSGHLALGCFGGGGESVCCPATAYPDTLQVTFGGLLGIWETANGTWNLCGDGTLCSWATCDPIIIPDDFWVVTAGVMWTGVHWWCGDSFDPPQPDDPANVGCVEWPCRYNLAWLKYHHGYYSPATITKYWYRLEECNVVGEYEEYSCKSLMCLEPLCAGTPAGTGIMGATCEIAE